MSAKNRILLVRWLPFAFAITVACAAAYGVGQQVLRQSANDPQVGLAEDTASRLMKGDTPSQLVGSTIDVAQNAAPAIQIYDSANHLTASSLVINGQSNMTIPRGVLNQARSKGEDQVTWAPDDTRLAAVAVATSDHGDVVVAVRSLKHVEDRIDHLGKLMLAGWLLALGGSLGLQWFLAKSA